MIAGSILTSFDFREERVEVLALVAVVFSQSRLHQTPEAESVVHTHYTGTMRALVGLMLVHSK